ncbi:C-type cytochrome, putative [Mariprofundus ferrooxydans PV-1]|uniref:C-type cytochrome, putative n=2 Tax=Mariprofundus ferrooxydans TaxID=314344 RepID=Q0F144_9PROT|nr:C-type cytochrome, putative [Mariprofundus ferrooxydans PV-1]
MLICAGNQEVSMKKALLLAIIMLLTTTARAADNLNEGKQLLQDNCMGCHNAELDPPMGPPMFAVQKRYKMATSDRNDFINQLTVFTLHPSEDRAVMINAVELLGVMPDIGADEADVRKIAAYIHDTTFAPPCAHWQASIKAARARGDMRHAKKDQMMYNRMCK